MKRFALVLILVFCAACAIPFRPGPNQAEIEAADCGPAPVNYEKTIKAWIYETLYDPFTAQIEEIAEPKKSWWGTTGALLQPRVINYGWVVSAKINAKNRYGGYVGWKMYYFYFRDEKIKYTEYE